MHAQRKKIRLSSPQLLSFGDCLPSGCFHKHSQFRQVANFKYKNQLISVVNREVGRGPLNIVLQGCDLPGIDTLAKYKNRLWLNGNPLQLRGSRQYDSHLQAADVRVEPFLDNISFLQKILAQAAPAKSLAFLLDPQRTNHFQGRFAREFSRRMKKAVSLLLSGTKNSLQQAITATKGLGFGLTPSGDDFNTGFLAGLHLGETIFSLDLSSMRNLVYETARGTNLITNNFLRLAHKGLFQEKFKDLCLALLYKQEKEIRKNLKIMLNVGATSGADTLVGFSFAFKKVGNFGNKRRN